jgi:hypothetical protein
LNGECSKCVLKNDVVSVNSTLSRIEKEVSRENVDLALEQHFEMGWWPNVNENERTGKVDTSS